MVDWLQWLIIYNGQRLIGCNGRLVGMVDPLQWLMRYNG